VVVIPSPHYSIHLYHSPGSRILLTVSLQIPLAVPLQSSSLPAKILISFLQSCPQRTRLYLESTAKESKMCQNQKIMYACTHTATALYKGCHNYRQEIPCLVNEKRTVKELSVPLVCNDPACQANPRKAEIERASAMILAQQQA
jgi:hypothetical protein